MAFGKLNWKRTMKDPHLSLVLIASVEPHVRLYPRVGDGGSPTEDIKCFLTMVQAIASVQPKPAFLRFKIGFGCDAAHIFITAYQYALTSFRIAIVNVTNDNPNISKRD